MHLTDSDYDMKAAQSSRKASIPVNKQDHCVNDQILNHQRMLLSAFNELKAKEYLRIPMHLWTRQNNTVNPAVQQHLEWLSFNWETYFSSSSSSTWTESPTWWSSSPWDQQWQEWHSQGWQDKERWDHRCQRQRQSHAQTSTRRFVRGGQSEKVSIVGKFRLHW